MLPFSREIMFASISQLASSSNFLTLSFYKKIKSCLDEKKKKCLHTQQVHPNMHGWMPNQCSFPFRMALFFAFSIHLTNFVWKCRYANWMPSTTWKKQQLSILWNTCSEFHLLTWTKVVNILTDFKLSFSMTALESVWQIK